MDIIKKLFFLSNNDDCIIGLCHFNSKNDFLDNNEIIKKDTKETTLAQMLKRPI